MARYFWRTRSRSISRNGVSWSSALAISTSDTTSTGDETAVVLLAPAEQAFATDGLTRLHGFTVEVATASLDDLASFATRFAKGVREQLVDGHAFTQPAGRDFVGWCCLR